MSNQVNAALMAVAQPNLYRHNAFRIAQLPVTVDVRDVLRRQQIVALSTQTGLAVPAGPGQALPLAETSDLTAFGNAMQTLHAPEQRLIEELFWFWPMEPGSEQPDEALDALRQGEVPRATSIWHRQQMVDGQGNIPLHNLAVLAHVTALDMEYASWDQSSLNGETAQCDVYWQEALHRWQILITEDGFWKHLEYRIVELDDPRLTPALAADMRTMLPLALLSINAQLALQAARQGKSKAVARQIGIMRNSGFDTTVVEEALRRAVAPIRQQIKALAAVAEEDTRADPRQGDAIAKRLAHQTQPLLHILDLLPTGDSTRDSMHDEVALAALGCLIPFGNRTEQWKTTHECVQELLKIAIGASARTRIKENIETVKNNLLHGTCWYCQERSSDTEAEIEKKLYGNVTRTPTFFGTQTHIQWETRTVSIPRCKSCQAVHKQREHWIIGGVLVSFLVGLALAIFFDTSLAACSFVVIGATIIGGLVGKIVSSLKMRNTPDLSFADEFPQMRALLQKGWVIGEKPPDVG